MKKTSLTTYDQSIVDNCRIETLQDYWIDVPNRQIWIRGIEEASSVDVDGQEPGVEYMMATRVIMNLNMLRLDNNDPVTVHMHSCGGIWEEGMAIYDAIKSMPYHVTVISYTHARSMSSIIIQAADTRLLMPSSYMMLHFGSMGYEGEVPSFMSNAEKCKQDTKTMIDLYVTQMKTGRKFKDWTEKAIREFLLDKLYRKGDLFLTPSEAISWGLSDGIFERWTPGKKLIVKKR